MIKAALCDDEAEYRSAVGELLLEYAASRPELALKTSVFPSGQALLAAAEEDGGFDLYILDVVMPELSGIDVGLRLREMGREGAIIYLTVSPEYALDSYQARAFHYLLKPVDSAQFFRVLDEAAAALEKRRSASVAVQTKEGLRLARLDEIQYAELLNRTVRYHLNGGRCLNSVTLRVPFLKETAPLLEDPRFFRCGASFLANLFYVKAVEKGYLRMDDGARVPLSRGLAAQARSCWQDYWLNGLGKAEG